MEQQSESPIAVLPEPKRELLPEQRGETKSLPPYNVVLLNDEEHTYDYVIEMMQKIFGMSLERAYQAAVTVDTQERVVCCTTHKEHAELKRDQIHSFGRDIRMSISKGSMSSIIEPAFADGDPDHPEGRGPDGSGQDGSERRS